jgi:hypothetical protein
VERDWAIRDVKLSDDGLLGRYSGPEVRTWGVGEPERFSMVGVILSQKMYPILCPPYRQPRTVVHSQPHPTVSTKLLFFSSNAENGRFVLDGPPALGAGGPEFESRRPDQFMISVFHHFETHFLLAMALCEFLVGRRSDLQDI